VYIVIISINITLEPWKDMLHDVLYKVYPPSLDCSYILTWTKTS